MDNISGETVAWIAAGGTAAGALIGSAAGGCVDFVLDRIRERRTAKAGARIVGTDISTAASRLKAAEDDGLWWDFYETRMPGWDRYQDVLSARLSDDGYDKVAQSVYELGELGDQIARAPKPPTGQPCKRLSDTSRASLRTMRENATAAYNALAEMAGLKSVTGLLHDE